MPVTLLPVAHTHPPRIIMHHGACVLVDHCNRASRSETACHTATTRPSLMLERPRCQCQWWQHTIMMALAPVSPSASIIIVTMPVPQRPGPRRKITAYGDHMVLRLSSLSALRCHAMPT